MGALDDGAGCAITLEVGRHLALFPDKPKRTVRVVLFANEEFGDCRAKAYAKAHEAEVDKHYVAIEADLGDGRAYEVKLRASPEGDKALVDYSLLLFQLGVFIGDNQAEGGADVSPLRALGVPVADVRQDATRYFDVHHSANDVLEKIVKADLDQATAAFGALIHASVHLGGGSSGRIPRGDARPEALTGRAKGESTLGWRLRRTAPARHHLARARPSHRGSCVTKATPSLALARRSPTVSVASASTRLTLSGATPEAAMNARACSLAPYANSSGLPCAMTFPSTRRNAWWAMRIVLVMSWEMTTLVTLKRSRVSFDEVVDHAARQRDRARSSARRTR